MRPAHNNDEMFSGGDAPLPAFVERAKEDARCRVLLARMGYRRVKAAYNRQLRAARGDEFFRGLEDQGLSPSLDMVGDWLKAEKKRSGAPVGWTFAGVMLVTIGTVLTMVAGYFVFK